MESADIHHQLPDHLVGFPSSLATPSCDGVGSTSHAWTPNSISNTSGFNTGPYEMILSSREHRQKGNIQPSSHYSFMAPDMAFHWANPARILTSNRPAQDSQPLGIKEEITDNYYDKYSELLSSRPSPSSNELSLRNEQSSQQSHDISTKFLIRSLFSSGNLTDKKNQLAPGDLYSYPSSNGATNNPSIINVWNLKQEGLTSPPSLDMNLETQGLLTSSILNGNCSPSLLNQIGVLKDAGFCYGLDNMHQSYQMPLFSSNKISATSFSNGSPEANLTSAKMEPKALQTAPRKSRLEARASCPPFKVRKQKLGDRIAALQQLVAPLGKKDTASVLMGAIGYIKFLQDQVETMIVPYMKSTKENNKANIVMANKGRMGNENEEPKRDLWSRGLCLFPLSYVADGGGAVVCPPPCSGGET